MQFDDFDKKIKDAAEHHHPAYDEKAWEKMEKLLNKHLPVEKDDRRRIIFFLLLFLLLGTGAYLLIHHLNQNKIPVTTGQNKITSQNTSSPLATDTKSNNSTENTVANKNTVSTNKNSQLKNDEAVTSKSDETNGSAPDQVEQPQTGTSGVKENLPLLKTPEKIAKQERQHKQVAASNKNIASIGASRKKNSGDILQYPLPTENNPTDAIVKSTEAPVKDRHKETEQKSGDVIVNTPDPASQKKPDQQDLKKEGVDSSTVKKKVSKKTDKQKQFPLAITFTTGPDLSFVGLSQLGSVELTYGAGLSYSIKRFTLRSGFYVSRKVYSAGASDYHPYYANLQEVYGDCKVFEIPLTISYNFAQAKNHNWFASSGLSSYLMKKETYVYLSKDPATGTTDYYSRTWNNKNKHYFSVLDLSAGYERKFTKSISLIAEPYLKIPLSGIGNGKMKLSSAGLLLTLSVKPFASKK
ncbi:MAG: hypothetical protein JWM28_3623 [Chitinophagaceae bacterium]|nr:hypothetical protein [Chitinophagaceae bacterium]